MDEQVEEILRKINEMIMKADPVFIEFLISKIRNIDYLDYETPTERAELADLRQIIESKVEFDESERHRLDCGKYTLDILLKQVLRKNNMH